MPEGSLLVVLSSIGLWVMGWVGLWVQSFYFAMGWVRSVVWWVGLKKLDPRTALTQTSSGSAIAGDYSLKVV